MGRGWTIVLLLCAAGGCSKRAAPGVDGAPGGDGAAADTWVRADGPMRVDAGGLCTTLVPGAQATLEYADTLKTTPALDFDGEQFAVVWHSQPAPVSSLNGELRLALVDSAGKPSAPDGVSLGGDNGVLEPALLAAPNKYTVIHLPSGAGNAVLRSVDAAGKTLDTTTIGGTVTHAALAQYASGVAVLKAGPSGNPGLIVLDSSGSMVASSLINTAQVMESLWLAPRSGGLVAALHSTNSNATLYLLDGQLVQVGMAPVGHGALVKSPGFGAMTKGFAAAFLTSSGTAEVEVYDDNGQAVSQQTLGTASVSGVANPTALTAMAWTGQRLVAGYPSAVPGHFVLRVLDAAGSPVGSAVQLVGCLAVGSAIRLAWGNGLLAAVTLEQASGVAKSGVCVTLLSCQ